MTDEHCHTCHDHTCHDHTCHTRVRRDVKGIYDHDIYEYAMSSLLSGGINLAIVGGRDYPIDPPTLTTQIDNWIATHNDGKVPNVIVSGGANGIDTFATHYAKLRGLYMLEVRPGVPRW